jgi:hypothetical protein
MGRQRRAEGIEVDSGSALIPDSEAGKKTLGRKKNYRNKCDGGSKALILKSAFCDFQQEDGK